MHGLEGFLGARSRHRVHAAALLRRRDGAVLAVRSGQGGWGLPGGFVRAAATPRQAAAEALRRLALDPALGRLAAQDFRAGDEGGTEHRVYDAGTWDADTDGFTADGGRLRARFLPPAAVADGDTLVAAALRAIELGTVAELEDGEETSDVAPGAPAPAMMPDLAGLRGTVGEPAAGRPVRPATYSL